MANLLSTSIAGAVLDKEGTPTTASGTTLAVDLSTARFFEVDMGSFSGQITTFTITGIGSTEFIYFTIKFTQASTARDFSWAGLSSIKWPGGGAGAPTMTSTDNKVDIYSFTTWDNGTTWYGQIIGQNY